MTTPIHAYYLRSDQHTAETIHQTLLEAHLDEIWMRITTLDEVRWGGAPVTQLELYQLRDGTPMLPDGLGQLLSLKDRSALRLSVDSTRTTVGYELFRDGKPGPTWAGNVESLGEDATEKKKKKKEKEALSGAAVFAEMIHSEVGIDYAALIAADPINEKTSERALTGGEALVRGRFVQLMRGMGRWAELFFFHDRNEEDESTEREEHVALIALDLKQAERLWRRTPAGQVYQFLRLIEPMRQMVLGPLAVALPEVLEAVQRHPPEQSLAADARADPTIFEVLAMATALVYMIGDRVSYLDERFFPLLSLSDTPPSRAAIEESIDDITSLGILSAVTEVVPYTVPEGQIMEAIADDEISPLAPWAVQDDDSYEGSLVLLDPTRLAKLVDDFDIEAFKTRVQAFRETWFAVDDPSGGSAAEWAEPRQDLDQAELDRFEDTFVELQHTLGLAALNNLTPALLFYS
jgi:hypothetical protein